MAANIGGDGDWTIHHIQAVREIAKHKSCQFRAHVEGFNKKTKIGNEDIRDLVFSSIEQFQQDGRVGAIGKMTCAGGHTVRWEIKSNMVQSNID